VKKIKTILSYGGGVNSTAILALVKLGKLPMPDYVVFADTGTEYPYTYNYLNYLEKQGISIIYLSGCYRKKENTWETLIEYCQRKRIIPSQFHRWCSMDWKVRPIELFRGNTEMWIGIDYSELHRVQRKHGRNVRFPLIEMGIDRNECKRIIKKVGWGIPLKSGCFICPYQSRKDWINLREKYPYLYSIARNLEEKSRVTFVQGVTLDNYTEGAEKQMSLDMIPLNQDCRCYFD